MVEATTIIILVIALIAVFIAFRVGASIGASRKHTEWEQIHMPVHRKDAISRSRSVLGGMFSENLAPFLPDFPFKPNECSFLGKPIDFVVFKGSDEKQIDEVVFVEVKSGKAKLNSQEKNLKETIEKKRVRWEEYRIPEEITKKRDEGLEEL
jgi:predicted Holliday junction resolvase-like endonuclease